MAILRCTAKLLKEIGCKPSDIDDLAIANGLNVWFANLLWLDRRKCVLFTNEKTLFSFLVPDLKREKLRDIGEIFAKGLSERLAAEGMGKHEKMLVGDRTAAVITRTNNKSVLGSMNDLALQIEYHVKGYGGLENIDLKKLNRELNRVPMGPLGYRYAIEMLEDELSAGSI